MPTLAEDAVAFAKECLGVKGDSVGDDGPNGVGGALYITNHSDIPEYNRLNIIHLDRLIEVMEAVIAWCNHENLAFSLDYDPSAGFAARLFLSENAMLDPERYWTNESWEIEEQGSTHCHALLSACVSAQKFIAEAREAYDETH